MNMGLEVVEESSKAMKEIITSKDPVKVPSKELNYRIHDVKDVILKENKSEDGSKERLKNDEQKLNNNIYSI